MMMKELYAKAVHRQNLTAAEMADRYLAHLDAIAAACVEPGPAIYAVQERRIERLDLTPP